MFRQCKPIDAIINVYNIEGQRIGTEQLNNESSTSISIANYKGVAVVSVVSLGRTITEKVVVWQLCFLSFQVDEN